MEVMSRQIFDYSFRGAFLVNLYGINELSILTQGRFIERVLTSGMYTEFVAMCIPPFHKFYEVVDQKIQQLFTAGIINIFAQEIITSDDKKAYAHLNPQGPQVLTMKHLEAGFVVWLISLNFAVIAFMLEWATKVFEIFLLKLVVTKVRILA